MPHPSRAMVALRLATSLGCAGLIVVLTGCASSDAETDRTIAEPGQPGHQIAFDGIASMVGEWSLAALRGVPIGDIPTEGVREMPSMRIEPDGRASGGAGVNRWFSSFAPGELAERRLAFAPAGSTMMAGSEQAMALERGFLNAIKDVRRIDPAPLTDNQLRLLDDEGNEVLRFTRSR